MKYGILGGFIKLAFAKAAFTFVRSSLEKCTFVRSFTKRRDTPTGCLFVLQRWRDLKRAPGCRRQGGNPGVTCRWHVTLARGKSCRARHQTVMGVLLFSRSRNMICCLAVDPEYRKQGLASILLSKALGELDRSKEISVSTFRENDDRGIAPRALYKKFGFQEGEMTEEFGYPNQVFVLRP